MFTEEGRPYMTANTWQFTARSTATVYGNGTGIIKINGMDINYFKRHQDREEVS